LHLVTKFSTGYFPDKCSCNDSRKIAAIK